MANILYKGPIGKEDIYWGTGTFTRRGSLGTVTMTKVPSGHEYDALIDYGGSTAFTTATINAALAAIDTTAGTLLLRPGTWAVTSNVTIPANVALEVPKGAILSISTGVTLTINGPFDAGDYQVFSGTGNVVFGQGAVDKVLVAWFYSGSGDAEAPIEAALNSVSYGTPIPVELPAGLLTYAGTLNIPKGGILKGNNCGVQTAAADSATYLYHNPSVSDVDAIVTDTTSLVSCDLSDFYLAGSTGSATSRTGIVYHRILSGRIRNVRITGAFATAGIHFDGLQDVDVDNLMILNSGTTAMAAAVKITSSVVGLSTTTRFRGLYIGGRNGNATGGIVDGIVAERYATIGFVFYSPVIESVSRYAVNIYKRNNIEFVSPYVENVPTVDAATPIMRIGKDGATGDGLGRTHVGIRGGFLSGTNSTYNTNFAFDVDLSGVGGNLLIHDVYFANIKKFMDSASTSIGTVVISSSYAGTLTSFGTISTPSSLIFDPSNSFNVNPTSTRGYGTTYEIPTSGITQGDRYYGNAYKVLYIHDGSDVRSFTYDTGTQMPRIEQLIYGETSGAVIRVLGSSNSGGWGGSGTGTIYYTISSGTPVTGEHFHVSASGAGNLICNTTSGDSSASDLLGWKIQPGGASMALDDTGTPYLSTGSTGYIPASNNFTTGGTTAITDFLHGQGGQIITITSLHNITIADGATIILAGGSDFAMKSGDTLMLQYNRTLGAWVEVSRSVN